MSGEVEKFVRFLVEMGGIYDVDDEGYVINRDEEGSPVTIKASGSKSVYKRLMVMKDVIADDEAIIINPFSENASIDSPDAVWLYTQLSVGFTTKVTNIVNVVNMIASAKDDVAIPYTSEAIKFAANYQRFSDKELKLFHALSERKIEFMNTVYIRKLKKAKFRCSIYDPEIIQEHPNVPKKTWGIVMALISDILGINPETADADLERYASISTLITVPKLDSILRVYLALYQQINPTLMIMRNTDAMDDLAVDITTLSHHIDNLEKYYEKAKWFNTVKDIPTKTIDKSPADNKISISGGSISLGYNKPSFVIPGFGPEVGRPSVGGFHQPTPSFFDQGSGSMFGYHQPPMVNIPIR